MANPGMLVRGRGSWFGGPRDSMDSGATALGLTTATPGVAVRPGGSYMSGRATLGGYWRVRAPNGKVAIIRQTDIGPNQSTGRRIDVTYSALRQLGYNERNFPTDAGFSARYLGKRRPSGADAYPAARPAAPASSPVRKQTITVPDQGARQQALRSYLAVRGRPGALLDLAHGMDATTTQTVTTPGPVRPRPSAPARGAVSGPAIQGGRYHPSRLRGTANFEGSTVAAWIKPALVYARQHGWKGGVNSGFRSYADQVRIWNSGVRPAARPGTSNHEGSDFPRGAVDVSDAAGLARALRGSPFQRALVYAGGKDPVHFSHPHGGSY